MSNLSRPVSSQTSRLASLCFLAILRAWNGSSTLAGEVQTWQQSGSEQLAAGKIDQVVVSDLGRLRLGRRLTPAAEGIEADQVWGLATSADGACYAATGNQGLVFRRPDPAAPWARLADLDDTQALCILAAGKNQDRLLVGTGPSGQLHELSAPGRAALRPDPAAQYIWALAGDAAGNVYAATGPSGQLWKLSPEGTWTLLLDSKSTHLLSLAVKPDGTAYVGTDGEGLIYEVSPAGRVSVLYDSPHDEVRALLIAPDGALYAGTATPESTSGSSSTSRSITSLLHVSSSRPLTRPAAFQVPGGTATPKAPGKGENVVYRFDADRAAREVFRARAMIFALAWQGGHLLVGTGPEGKLFEVLEPGRESVPLAQVEAGQILSLLPLPNDNNRVLIGTGSPGAIHALLPGYQAQGTLTSTVHDAKLSSRFGTLFWEADTPPGTSLSLQVRTGNVGTPDETWSPWSDPQTDQAAARADAPTGRYVQYRANLATTNPALTPVVNSVGLRYQTINLAPELSTIEVPDLAEADGDERQTELTFKWKAADPNDDDLSYLVELKKETWPAWVKLGGSKPTRETELKWDSTSVPSGAYRLRITATDAPANRPEEALEQSLTSDLFLVDHEAPSVKITTTDTSTSHTITIADTLTRLVKASYTIDGGDWTPIFPTDGLFDSTHETVALKLETLDPGVHILRVKATDAAGNTGASDLVIELKARNP